MRSKQFLMFGALSIGIAAASLNATGCDGGSSSTGRSSGGDTGGAGGTVSTSSSSGSTSSSSGGGKGGMGGMAAVPCPTDADGNCSPDTAVAIEMMGNQDINDDPQTDEDWFYFDGTAGDIYLISSSSHPPMTDQDPGYIDTFIELYAPDGKTLVATNDDRYPRQNTDSEIVTVLQETGKYYVKIQEFCISPLADPNYCNQKYFDALVNTDYVIGALKMTPGTDVTVEAEPNDAQGMATTVKPTGVMGMAGSYYLTVMNGGLPMAADVDYYKFTVPADLTVDAASRAKTGFLFPWGATTGNGSAVKVGQVEVIDSNMNVVAGIDMTAEPTNTFDRADINMPVMKAGDYFLKVTNGGAAASGKGDFYFAYQTLGGGNPVEKAEATNNMPATPEVLTLAAGSVGSYFVEGDIGAGDVDYFKIATKAQMTLSVACSAQRAGSGLRGFKVTAYNADGTTPVAAGSQTENATTNIFIDHIAIPAGQTDLVIKLEATMPQDAKNTGTYYLCGFHAGPPAM